MDIDYIECVGLPKWPQMIVTGKPVTVEQATEIIRRTDSFFTCGYTGNDRKFVADTQSRYGMVSPEDLRSNRMELREYRELQNAWQNLWGCVSTSYVHNSWVSCAFIGGPHGWCHPNGQIGFFDNIGKYPSVEEVRDDWKAVAAAFPFLDIDVTLMSKGSGEEGSVPVVGFRIRGTDVEVVTDNLHTLHQDHKIPEQESREGWIERLATGLGSGSHLHERGVPDSMLTAWDATWAALQGLKPKKRVCARYRPSL
jgi:hypothetical protein